MKVNDIRSKESVKRLEAFLKKDRERWLAGRDSFVRVKCPACGGTTAKETIDVRGMIFDTCSCCETVFYNPRPTQQQLKNYYENAESYTFWAKHIFPESEAARRKGIFRPLAARVGKYVKESKIKAGVLMEIGAGFGIFCDEIRKKRIFKRVIAVEPTPDLAQRCREKGLEVIEAPFEETDLPAESLDCIASFEVIEHVFSPQELIQRSNLYLKKRGLLFLKCPNVKGFDFMVLGKEKAGNFGLEHINMFNPGSMSILLEKNGFSVLDIVTPGKLDADIVRNQILDGKFDVSGNPFLKRVLVDDWEKLGYKFQRFLADNMLSSSMLAVARKC
ncbi:MAG: class I SAM-dependent methyltransferase [Candidatus Omnitrophota bacterium]